MGSSNSRAIKINKKQRVASSSATTDFIDNIPTEIGGVITDFLVEKFSTDESQAAEEKSFALEEGKDTVRPAFSWTMKGSLGLFNNLGLRSIAHELVAGNIDAAIQGILQMVKRYPNLMHEVCEITDHRGRRLRGTFLQLAAMNLDFNPNKNMKAFGAVERLVALGLLSAEEVKNQLVEVLGPHSEAATEERTNRRKAAVESLVDEIEALEIDPNAPWEEMRPLAEEIVQRFWARLNAEGDDVITKGFVFDPRIFDWWRDRFWRNDGLPSWKDRLGGFWSTKSGLLYVVSFGSLQAADSACGLQLHRRGAYQVAEENGIPDRSVNFSSDLPDLYLGLGYSFSLSKYNGVPRTWLWLAVASEWEVWLEAAGLQKCFQTKTAVLQKFMRTSARPHLRSRCIIL